MNDKPIYRKTNLEYIRSQLRIMDQEDTIDMLKEMNLEQLRYCMGAGIPGHANTIAIELLRKRREERAAFLAQEDVERIEETEVEKKLMLTTAPSLQQKATISVEDNEFVEGKENAKQRIHTSKKGRKRDSETV